jgi:hypothetical protein
MLIKREIKHNIKALKKQYLQIQNDNLKLYICKKFTKNV